MAAISMGAVELAAASLAGAVLVVGSAHRDASPLGAPLYRAWILNSLQVVALWAAGRDRWWAWLLGCGVQPVGIVYALVTDQIGFVPGCLISAFVQVRNFLIKEAARTAVVNSQPAQQ